MVRRLASLCFLVPVFAAAQGFEAIDIGPGKFVAGASRDNATWFVKEDGGQGGGFWSAGGYQKLQAPVGSLETIEPLAMSSNGDWIVGNAAYMRNDYVIYLPVLWNKQGQPTVLTEDMTYENAVAVSDDGQTILMRAFGGGAGVWKSGAITGTSYTYGYGMSADGSTRTFGKDLGNNQALIIESPGYELGAVQFSDVWPPAGSGISGDGRRVFGRSYTDPANPQNAFVDVASKTVTALDGPLDDLFGAPGFVSFDGSIAAGERHVWVEGAGSKTLTSLGFGSTVRVTGVGQNNRSVFLRDLATGQDFELSMAAVPEPATLAGLALGAFLLRRRRASAS